MTDRQNDNTSIGSDAGSIAGIWTPLWSTWEDIPTPPEDLHDVSLTFVAGRCEVRRGQVLIRSGTYATDSTRSPRFIDVCFLASDVPELTGATLRGLYEADAEKLRICYGPPGGDRAHSFSASAGTGQYLAEYRRRC
jgi:uncharacterized protein (TIGR03067 family)